jgi:hypothetical protein
MTILLELPRAAPARDRDLLALPPTEELLAAGGDTRIDIDPRSATNRYGCPSSPDPAVAAFGSSTASTVSPAGFAAAARLRLRLLSAAGREKPSLTYARELDRQRDELAALYGLSDLAGLATVFAASGTDLHLIAAQLLGGVDPLAIMVEATETGSFVAAALAGRHFSTRTAFGEPVVAGDAIAGGTIEIASVASRGVDGSPRPAALVDAEIVALATRAAAMGRRVLLTLVDVSKTGLIAPSPIRALALRDRLPDSVELLVDACQLRLAPSSLRAYLDHGFTVALTGSKFLTGPAFAGALLIPEATARRLRGVALAPALLPYSARAEWPCDWNAAGTLGDRVNYGLLLRWEAALAELRLFHAVPERDIAAILGAFAQAVEARLRADPAFESLDVPALAGRRLAAAPSWDHVKTIFPFLLRRRDEAGGARFLDRAESETVYRLLGVDATAAIGPGAIGPAAGDRAIAALRCQIGQPVACGSRAGHPVSALRLCASARLVTEAAAHGVDAVIARAMAALDKAALLAASV